MILNLGQSYKLPILSSMHCQAFLRQRHLEGEVKLERDDEEVEEEERSRVRLDKEEMGKEEIIEEEEQKLVDYDSARRRFLSESASAAGEIIMVIVVMKILADTFLKKSPAGTFLDDSLLAYSKSLF